ncbi:MAG: hypothetical protein ACLRP8_04375 [Roseburia intestinalis]
MSGHVMEPGRSALDVQFLPDVDVPCPECKGSRYAKEAWQICYENKQGNRYSLPQIDGDGCKYSTAGGRDLESGASAAGSTAKSWDLAI